MQGQVKRKNLRKALKRKGFREKQGSNHTKYFFYHKGKKTSISTVISRGSKYKKLGVSFLGMMGTELKMTNAQFESFIDCEFGESDYIEHLKDMRILN
jgi:hypothetical protein